MKNIRFKQIAILALVTVFAIGIPASFAKYMKDDSFNLNVKVEVPFTFTADTVTGENVSGGKITIKKSGWYAIAVKGGDGGSGYVGNSSGKYVSGGPGGLISIKVYLESGDVLIPHIGTAGGNGSDAKSGAAGSVTGALGGGGAGYNMPTVADSAWDWIAGAFSNSAASGGGGAATSVFVNDNSYSNLLCVAGGGGGGGAWSYYYTYPKGSWVVVGTIRTVPSGYGGAGGSNILTNASISGIGVTLPSTGSVFSGGNGKIGSIMPSGNDSGYYIYRDNGKNTTYGGGASNSGGNGSSSTNSWGVEASGSAGADYVSSSAGGVGASSKSYGGAGGGGYCGGGAGAGCSIDYSAGGGGGGSSFHKSSLNGKDITKYTSLSNLGLDIASVTYTPYHLNGLTNNVIYNTTESRIISKYPFIEYYTVTHYNYKNDPESEKYSVYNVTKSDSNVAGGFVIVKYLGQA